nr:tripartite tricarboxylate transporter substrate binding protein [Bordetella bronchiseptica]
MMRSSLGRLSACLVMLGCLMGFSAAGAAAGFPAQPITLVVPYPPGGTADSLARVLAKSMGARLGVNMIVLNKGGAGTVVGTQFVANSAADGYTLLFTATPFAINPSLFEKLPYDTLKDFTVVSDIAETPLVVAAGSGTSINTLGELVDRLKTGKDNSYGSAGPGSSPHLVSELLLHEVNGEATHIPYQGSMPAVMDLVANRTTFMFDTSLLMLPLAKEGRLKLLAQTSTQRSPLLPTVPTLQESGYPNLSVTSWFVVAARSGAPRDVLEKLNSAINAALADPVVAGAYEAQGMIKTGGTLDKAQAKLQQEVKNWALAVQVSGAKVR